MGKRLSGAKVQIFLGLFAFCYLQRAASLKSAMMQSAATALRSGLTTMRVISSKGGHGACQQDQAQGVAQGGHQGMGHLWFSGWVVAVVTKGVCAMTASSLLICAALMLSRIAKYRSAS